MNRKNIRNILIALLFLACASFLTVLHVKRGYAATEETNLNRLIQELTAGYRVKQISATVIMFAVGAVISIPLCKNIGQQYAMLLAMPVGNALWGIISAPLLFMNIPYTPYIMAGVIFSIIAVMVFLYKKEYRHADWSSFWTGVILALAVAVMASSGVFAIFNSSDSYYYVMQYGELIGQNQQLSSDISGTFMTWTGISPALTSAYAAMWGFENIYAIHYLLIFSMYGFISYTVYRKANQYCTAGKSFLCAALTLLTVMMIPAVSYLSIWVISNTYFMVYLVFLMMLPVIAGEKTDTRILCIMAAFAVWLMLSRIEAAPLICFLIICISSLNIPKKHISALFLSTFLFEALYLLKVLLEYLHRGKLASEQLLTAGTVAIILLTFVLTGLYLLLYDFKFMKFIRRHMAAFGIAALIISCLGLGALDMNKFLNNIQTVASNMRDWYWAYVPLSVLVIEVIKFCFKCRNQYFDLAVWGFILFNFAMCMGRPQYLRLGVGDSYNRICMSIVPLYVVSTIWTFIVYFGSGKKENKYGKEI